MRSQPIANLLFYNVLEIAGLLQDANSGAFTFGGIARTVATTGANVAVAAAKKVGSELLKNKLRRRAVARAWAMEKANVIKDPKFATYNWTAEQLDELKTKGKVRGFE